jgi:hypothetical protein
LWPRLLIFASATIDKPMNMEEYPLYRFFVKFWLIPLLGAVLFSFLTGVLVSRDEPFAVCLISMIITFLFLLLQLYLLVVAIVKQAWKTAIGFLFAIIISTVGSLFLFGMSVIGDRATDVYTPQAMPPDTTTAPAEPLLPDRSNHGVPLPPQSR